MNALRATGLALGILLAGAAAHAAAPTGAWTHYGGDAGDTKYSPLDQINAKTVGRVKVAWRTPALDPALKAQFPKLVVSNNFRIAPLVVDDVLYVSNSVGLVEARNPGTGALIWTQGPPPEGLEQGSSAGASRGIALWGQGAKRRVVTVRGSYLYLLDARTGAVDPSFGHQGRVDLREDPKDTRFVWNAPNPAVVGDVIVIGGQPNRTDIEDFNLASLPGDIRGYDVRTGRQLWTFHTVPREGEPGAETWLNGSWKDGGKTKVWSSFSVDEKLGYVYAPLSAPANDWYGGARPGANLYSDSLVALDARTGKRVWHQQLVHHDLWDYDLPTAPILADVRVNGKPRKAALQVTKTAHLFAFDRVTGEPLFPIEERPVPASDVPGEWTSPTQPIPLKPAPFDRVGLSEDQLIDFTPELRAEAVAILNRYRHGDIFTPPSLVGADGKQGTLYLPGWVGGANWTGAAVDPQTSVIYIPSVSVPYLVGLEPNGKGGYKRVRQSTLYVDGPRGLPLVKPPYGRITAIDLNSGDVLWSVPNGDGPRDHPALAGLKLPPLGQPGRAAPLLTRSLLFIGEGDKVGISMPPFSGGNQFRAYDKKTGAVVWSIDLGAGTTAPPVTYSYRGKQYIVVGIGGTDHPAELVALSLP